ncbi:uncharacterized protein EV420DRAFT_1477359 [Desarmillaria tabescens]|uniref:Uncharacterized protein n=1 Tax=Armillaria tabescens TaxID=1929756 RepID=A0AA39NBW0_ARMTA|nr:uncharacterized protein EV420DRAFT_1477359 [Desarmillaria tabescens]KAK0462668.1 hypothetical protein EV420DRAFT_1477359 [Desarmillaria tabescens]
MARTKATEMIAWRQMYEEGLARAAQLETDKNKAHALIEREESKEAFKDVDDGCTTLESRSSTYDTLSDDFDKDADEVSGQENIQQSRNTPMGRIVTSSNSKPNIYRNLFLDMEALDDDCEEESADDEELDQFIAQDDEADNTDLPKHTITSTTCERIGPTYLSDVIRRWDTEFGERSIDGNDSLDNCNQYGAEDCNMTGLAAGPLINHASIDESYIWRMKCRRLRGRYIAANILSCSEYVPIVQMLVRAVISIPSDPYCVYLEAQMSKALKDWLKTVPGIVVFNDSVILNAVDYSEWHKVMTYVPKYREPDLPVGDRWCTIGYGSSMGWPVFVIGSSEDTHQPGYDILMVPMLSLQKGAYDTYPVQSLEPMLFDATKMAIIHGEELLREIVEDTHFDFRGQDYEYGLLHRTPRPKSWNFYLGESVIVRGCSSQHSSQLFEDGGSRTCTIVDVHDTYLELDDIKHSGRFIVKEWHAIEKIFKVGQFVVKGNICGFVDVIELNVLHLIVLGGGQEKEQTAEKAGGTIMAFICVVDFNSIPWVGMCGVVLKQGSPFRGLLVFVKDVRVEKTHWRSSCLDTNHSVYEAKTSAFHSSHTKSPTTIAGLIVPGMGATPRYIPDLQVMLLVQRASYSPETGGGFSEMWVPYKEVVDAQTHLPLAMVPDSLIEQRFLPPIDTSSTSHHQEARSTTPLPTAEEGSLSPAWNPFSSFPHNSTCSTIADTSAALGENVPAEESSVYCHWTQDLRMAAIGDLKVRVMVGGRECRGSLIRHENRMQLRLLRGGIIEPHRILPRHPMPRNQHGSLWVIIRGEHCGVLVRGLRYFRHNDVTWWDVRVTERKKEGRWVYLNVELQVPYTDLNLVVEPTSEKVANQAEAYKMREFSRADYFKKV